MKVPSTHETTRGRLRFPPPHTLAHSARAPNWRFTLKMQARGVSEHDIRFRLRLTERPEFQQMPPGFEGEAITATVTSDTSTLLVWFIM